MTYEKFTLDTPIKHGDTEIIDITLRKPQPGELRGINLADLSQMDVSALIKVLPRITQPTLTEHDIATMDVADLTQLGIKVCGFLLPSVMKAADSPNTSKTPSPT